MKALKKHNYDVASKFSDADFKSVARFIAWGKIFDILNYTRNLRIENKIGQSNFKTIELEKVIILSRHSKDEFTLT